MSSSGTTKQLRTFETVENTCNFCGLRENLLRCGRCKIAYYCCKEHQLQDWRKHKVICKTFQNVQTVERKCGQIVSNQISSAIPSGGSSENEILKFVGGNLSPNNNFSEEKSSTERALKSAKTAMPISGENIVQPQTKSIKYFPEIILHTGMAPLQHNMQEDYLEAICRTVIQHLNAYGLCVIDNFIGGERGKIVFSEVLKMQAKGVFRDGQLVSTKGNKDLKTIRSDQICWVDGKEPNCANIGYLLNQVDAVVMRANRKVNNGKLGQYNINGRTKAMLACYPGLGSHYVKHVDNPNRDGRCITAIYYLNLNWDVRTSGGLLRIFPEGCEDKVADIAPYFDRLLFFWSDRRNPHEVQPAYHTRYAITIWYFDAAEREEALRRYERERKSMPNAPQ